MALITRFNRKVREKYQTHQPIEADYYVLGQGKIKMIQIDTKGRKTREKPEKLSQTIQLDHESAKSLYQILKTEFQFD